jgi:hypothetical protein
VDTIFEPVNKDEALNDRIALSSAMSSFICDVIPAAAWLITGLPLAFLTPRFSPRFQL